MNAPRMTIALLFACLVVVGCSGSAKKKDDGSPGSEVVPGQPTDDFVVQDVKTEAVPEADQFQPAAGGAVATEVSSGTASDVASALKVAQRGNREKAARELAGLAERPDGFLAAFNLGVIRERQGAYDRAAQRYFQALQKNADFTPALENLLRLYLRKGQIGDAERLAQRFVNARPDNLGHRAALLQVGLFKGRFEDVIRDAKSLLRKDERHVGAMYAMAEANFELGRYELAKSIITGAVKLDPERADLFNTAGLIELRLDNKAGALANFQQAIKLRPSYPEAHNNLGVLYHAARDYAGAEEAFKQAIRDFPDFKEAYLNLGNAYKGGTKYKDAELAFKKTLSIDPAYPDGYFNLGVLYLDSEVPGYDPISRFQKSIEHFNQYKQAARGRLDRDDPADKYIEEAKKAIEVERQKQEMMRESQMGAEEAQ